MEICYKAGKTQSCMVLGKAEEQPKCLVSNILLQHLGAASKAAVLQLGYGGCSWLLTKMPCGTRGMIHHFWITPPLHLTKWDLELWKYNHSCLCLFLISLVKSRTDNVPGDCVAFTGSQRKRQAMQTHGQQMGYYAAHTLFQKSHPVLKG